MKWIILSVLFAETNGIQLRGMYQKQREKIIENKSNEYFIQIYSGAIMTASLSEKYNNYSFYEYGCIPLNDGMVDNKYTSHIMEMCDVHQENIEYYTNLVVNRIDVDNVYTKMIYNVLKTEDEIKHYHITIDEINNRVLEKIKENIIDISIKKETHNCCDEYTITW